MLRNFDVFVTNMRPDARRRLQIDVEQVRAHNPAIIYVRGSGFGARGPDVQRAGYDATAYWMRSGIGAAFTPADAERPVMQRPAFGDVVGGLTIAGAIAAAMYRRATTGEPSIVDVSLLGLGMWQLQPEITHAGQNPAARPRVHDRKATWNPLSGPYRTRDGRFIHLNIDDPRFVDMPARKLHARECVEALDEIFAARDYADWCEALRHAKGAWAPMQTVVEVRADPQVAPNGFLAEVEMVNGSKLSLVTSPAQFDEESAQPLRAPELGEHTEEALLELGLSWDELSALKLRKIIG
jgi:crotonobetainyl-CoA:carnitine CoA-transferase CaiB-like acyl-CoA transferase